jgi:cobalt-zinc-cadmium efflux system membrane fusion protein
MNIPLRYKPLLIAVVLLALSCSTKTSEPPAPTASATPLSTEVILTPEQFKTASIQLGKIEQRIVGEVIKANGILDVPPQNLVTISAPLGGFVKNTELLQGMNVRKGAVVAIMENPEYIQLQEDYLVSKNQLEYLQLEFNRQEELAKENVNAAKTLQQSRSNYFGTKAKVQGLSAKLKLIHIDPAELEKGSIQNTISLYSPIAGFVTQVNVNIGMHVNPNDIMFRIVDTEHLHAEAQVFEKDITKLKIGQVVRIKLINDTNERLAKVYLIGKEITPDRTVRVHCHLDKEDPSLIPGMYFNAFIETTGQPVSTLPDRALVTYEGKKYIFIPAGSTNLHFEMIEIKTGIDESGFTEVILPEHLRASSLQVVVNGAYELLAKLKNSDR